MPHSPWKYPLEWCPIIIFFSSWGGKTSAELMKTWPRAALNCPITTEETGRGGSGVLGVWKQVLVYLNVLIETGERKLRQKMGSFNAPSNKEERNFKGPRMFPWGTPKVKEDLQDASVFLKGIILQETFLLMYFTLCCVDELEMIVCAILYVFIVLRLYVLWIKNKDIMRI